VPNVCSPRTPLAPMDDQAKSPPNNGKNLFTRLNYDIRCVIYNHLVDEHAVDPILFGGLRYTCRQAWIETDEFATRNRARLIEKFNKSTGYLKATINEDYGTGTGVQLITVNIALKDQSIDLSRLYLHKQDQSLSDNILGFCAPRVHIHLSSPAGSDARSEELMIYWLKPMLFSSQLVPVNAEHVELSWAPLDVSDPAKTVIYAIDRAKLARRIREHRLPHTPDRELPSGIVYAESPGHGRMVVVSRTPWRYSSVPVSFMMLWLHAWIPDEEEGSL
jgi:hypothetical protein